MKKLFNIFLLFLGFTLSFAQQYPVRLIPVVIPPYSLKLGDYATSTDNKLQLQVLMTDLMEPQHQTGIKFTLEAGLNAVPFAQSNDFVVGMQPFTLFPGSNITLTNIDVRALFELQNLNGINAVQYAQPLSDGVYRYCFQAYDYYTKRNLSDKSCTTVFLVQYEPPMLNLPQKGEKVIKQGDFQNLVFQWMPRQIAPNTRYIFTLKELWDLERDPVSGFLSSPPLWREETYAPTLFYGMDKTQLIAGKRYAWQVQAKSGNPVLDANPTEDNGVYRNNGLSEIFYFDYVENCAVPTLLMAKNAGRGRVELSWSLAGQPSTNPMYSVQYRKRGSTSQWQTVQSYQPRYVITGLEDQTEYEYRIGSVCGNLQTFNNTNPVTDGDSAGNAYAYSGVQFFTTDSKDKTNQNYQCGVMPTVDITNKSPLQSLLGANEVFTAGDFPVTVISAQGSNGIYSGTGYIVVPYLADTKVKVSFNNIKLNTDKKLIEGVIETTYDPNESAVAYASSIVGETFGDQGVKEVTIDFPIGGITYSATPPPGKITITGSDGGGGTGSTVDYPGGKDYQFTDPKGNIWTVDENGTVTQNGKVAEGGASNSTNTDGVTGSGSSATVNQYTAKGITLQWEEIPYKDEQTPYTKYAYDTQKKTNLPTDKYPSVKDADGNPVSVSYKATVNKQTELFNAKVSITDPALKDAKIEFKTLSIGKAIEATELNKTDTERNYQLKLVGAFDYAEEEVIAVLMPKDAKGKQQVISSFRLVHLSPKDINVALVPTDAESKNNLSNIETHTNAIYKKVGVKINFNRDDVFDIAPYLNGSTVIPTEKNTALSTYSSVQQSINKGYGNKNSDRYILFVADRNSDKAGQLGYMRLNGQFGYVFKEGLNLTKTGAHELGHGIFKLEHPFENLGLGEKTTPLLMDYRTGDNDIVLSHLDWKQINDPAFKLYAFQSQSSGEFNGGYAVAPDYSIFSVNSSTVTDEIDYTKEENKGYANDGTLPGFKLNNKYYYWKEGKYITKIYKEDGSFDKELSYDLQKIEKNKLDPKKYIYLFFNKNNPCGLTTYKYVLAEKYSKFTGSSLSEFIHQNDGERKDLPCSGNGNNSGTSNNANDNWQYEKEAKGNNANDNDCVGFTYLSQPTTKDIQLVKEAFLKGFNARKSITSEERNQGTLNHIQIANATSTATSGDLPSDEMELLEDKLHLLSYYKKDIYIGVVFLKKDSKEFYKQDVLDNLSSEVIKQSKGNLAGKKALLIIVPYAYKFDKESKCLPSLGFAQTQDNDVVRYADVKTDNVKNWFSRILAVYAQVPKPLIVNRYYKTADGTIMQRSESASKDIKGYPFIKTLNFYESKGYEEIIALNNKYKGVNFNVYLGKYIEYLNEGNKIYLDYTTKEQQEGAINNPNIWKQIATDDLGKFREIYMDNPKLTNKLWEKSKDSWAWGSKVEIALDNSPLETKYFYNFDKITLLDDVVYGTLDGIGVIPGIDTFTDPIGAVYAGVRGDYGNATIYGASFAIPLAGSAYIKGALKTGEDASHLFGIVAKKADNAEGYILEVKKINQITADEVHLSSVYFGGDQKLTQKVLDQVKNDAKYIDGNFVRDALKYKKAVAPLLGDAKSLIVKAFGRSTKFADDPKTLEKVAEFLSDANKNALQSVGGKDGLEEIIRANVRVGCATCGTASTNFLKNMDEYLDDVLDFSTKYSEKDGFEEVLKELKKVNTSGSPNYAMEGAAFMLDKIKRTPEITPTSVKKFDGKFEGEIDHICEKCRFDIELNDGTKFEYKSYNEASINRISTSDVFLKQHLSYLADADGINKLRYEFDDKKFSDRSKIVEQFKKMYEKKIDDVFNTIWDNNGLKKDFFETNITKADAKLDFIDLVKDTKSEIYKFIKVE